MSQEPLRIATRGSKLALIQAHLVVDRLAPLVAPRPCHIVEVKTSGDRLAWASLRRIGGQGVFTREVQQALLTRRADLAVHSLKDLPTESVAGLTLAAVPERASAADVLVSMRVRRLADIPRGGVVATSSVRRRAQLLHLRPDLHVVEVRGNVETRLRKLREQDWDGLLLAEAGLVRLGLSEHIAERLDPAQFLPAVGQGALAVECRTDQPWLVDLVRQLDHAPSRQAVTAERALLRALGGGCSLPVAAWARYQDNQLVLDGAILSPDGRQRLDAQVRGVPEEAEKLGLELARRLLDAGAEALLVHYRST
ncbi:MAG: hydroxymethylbilane synthase [Gemmataceae bacterium]